MRQKKGSYPEPGARDPNQNNVRKDRDIRVPRTTRDKRNQEKERGRQDGKTHPRGAGTVKKSVMRGEGLRRKGLKDSRRRKSMAKKKGGREATLYTAGKGEETKRWKKSTSGEAVDRQSQVRKKKERKDTFKQKRGSRISRAVRKIYKDGT